MRKPLTTVLLAVLIQIPMVSPTPAFAQQQSLSRQAPSATQFAEEMASSDLFEIEAARWSSRGAKIRRLSIWRDRC